MKNKEPKNFTEEVNKILRRNMEKDSFSDRLGKIVENEEKKYLSEKEKRKYVEEVFANIDKASKEAKNSKLKEQEREPKNSNSSKPNDWEEEDLAELYDECDDEHFASQCNLVGDEFEALLEKELEMLDNVEELAREVEEEESIDDDWLDEMLAKIKSSVRGDEDFPEGSDDEESVDDDTGLLAIDTSEYDEIEDDENDEDVDAQYYTGVNKDYEAYCKRRFNELFGKDTADFDIDVDDEIEKYNDEDFDESLFNEAEKEESLLFPSIKRSSRMARRFELGERIKENRVMYRKVLEAVAKYRSEYLASGSTAGLKLNLPKKILERVEILNDEFIVYHDEVNYDDLLVGYVGSSKKVIIPPSIDIIGRFAFAECNTIEEVIMPNSVDKIKKCAFQDCKNLRGVLVSNNLSGIAIDVFRGCDKLNYTYEESQTAPDCEIKYLPSEDNMYKLSNIFISGNFSDFDLIKERLSGGSDTSVIDTTNMQNNR